MCLTDGCNEPVYENGLCKRCFIITKYARDMVRAEDESSLVPDRDLARNTVWGMLRDGELNGDSGTTADGFQPEDCFGAAYQGLMKGASRIDLSMSEGEQVNFLTICIRNQVRDFLRAERRYREVFEYNYDENHEDVYDEDTTDRTKFTAEIEAKVAALSNWQDVVVQTILKSYIAKLPERYKPIFEMKFNDPMVTAEEIGQALDIPTKTVESYLRRGRKLIRKAGKKAVGMRRVEDSGRQATPRAEAAPDAGRAPESPLEVAVLSGSPPKIC